jgi:methylenetetrahydrofolate reductase (NADPH)
VTLTVPKLLTGPRPSFSYEFMPPRTDEDEAVLWRAIRDVEPLRPAFVDVTYGAGGSRRDRTLRTVERVVAETGLTVVAHLTCVGATAAELRAIVRRLGDVGVRAILALRGDPPGGPAADWQPTPGGLDRAEDLVRLVKEEGDFAVGVGAYPQRHRESADDDANVKFFVAKCAAGADFAITQFFYEATDYTRFVTQARAAGCTIPIVPGVMPVTGLGQITRFPELSGNPFPPDLAARLRAAADPAAVRAIGTAFATALARDLLVAGAPGIHLYTLNRSKAAREIHLSLMS